MKSYIALAALAALVSQSTAQPFGGPSGGWVSGDFPSCASSCAPQWDGTDCKGVSWGDCICKNETVISSLNSCISSSSCSDADKASTYQKIASLCAAAGTTLTAAPEASFTGSSLSGVPWSSGPWSNGAGFGPFGGGSWGSGAWTSGGPWTSGPWTEWWGENGCPDSSWTGWTSGTWSKNAPWTSWTACTATTTATATFTTTNTAGAVVTATNFAVQVKEEGGAATFGVRGSPGSSFGLLVAGLAGVMMVVMVVL